MQIQNSSSPPFHSISNFIFILIYIIISSSTFSFSLREEEARQLFHYCSSIFRCGKNFPNITYPFWGGSKHPDCGLNGFHLTCQRDDYLTIEIAGQTFRVLNISHSSYAFRIARDDLWNDVCPENYSDASIDAPLFRRLGGVQPLSLYYDCHDAEPKNRSFSCTNSSDYSRNELFVEDLRCESSITVLVLEDAYQEFTGKTSMTLLELLYQGFDVEYSLDPTACLRCEDSGGLCWKGTNSTTPQCLCSEGLSEVMCPMAGQGNTTNLGPKINKPNVGLKIGIGFGASGGSIIIMCLIFYVYQRREKKKHSGSTLLSREISSYSSSVYDPEKGLSNYGVHIFEYSELEQATNTFDPERELGDGGFGTVYKAKLQDGRDVAVKRLYESNFKRVEQFRNEVLILTRLRHQNLVSLYGCTSRHCRELLLVYEYIPNGTVADHLHGELARPGSLPWSTRMKIAIETASALTYLHASDVIHRDVKTNNILLDNHFFVKVADFGLSRLFPINATHISTAPQGTPGYVDPEYHQCYQLTDKSDVFSFGVVLIELISSMPAVDISRHRHEINLSNMAINKIQSRSLHELVDPNLGFESDYNTRMMITDVAELAFRCLQHERDLRPSMEEVLEALKEIQSRDYSTGNAKERDIQEDDVKLLNARNLTSSPDSVMGWVSSTTTPSTSN